MPRWSHPCSWCAALVAALPVPSQSVYPTGTTISTPAAFQGRTLFAVPSGGVVLIDMQGQVVHRWTLPGSPTSTTQVVKALPNLHVLVIAEKKAALELDANSNVVWRWLPPAGIEQLHHDIAHVPNGNTVVIGRQTITVPSISSQPLGDDCLFEVDSAGNVVWSWYAWQHIGEFGFPASTLALIAQNGGIWAHVNSVDPLPPNRHTGAAFRPGNLLISQRATSGVFIIDRATGSVVWSLWETNGQHNAHMIPPGLRGAGNIMVFDNGNGSKYRPNAPGYSRVIEVDPPSRTVVAVYNASSSGLDRYTFWSAIFGSAQRLPNGNTLICSGVRGRLFEVDAGGGIVWEYMSPFTAQTPAGLTSMVYRAIRVGPP